MWEIEEEKETKRFHWYPFLYPSDLYQFLSA